MLECFSAESPALGIADMADMLDLTRSTTHRYALTHVVKGLLEQNSSRKYRLASGAADIGLSILTLIAARAGSLPVLEELREQTGHTASLGVMDGARAIYVQRAHSHGRGQYQADGDLRVGAHVPMHCTAIGKALLASLPNGEFRELLSKMRLERAAPNTITTKTLLTQEIERVRKDRIAFSDGEYVKSARSIAVPVTGRSGTPTLAVELTAPAGAYTMQDFLARVGPPLKHAAKQISV
jgi:DNA-binding IclR family transcriptional regulator